MGKNLCGGFTHTLCGEIACMLIYISLNFYACFKAKKDTQGTLGFHYILSQLAFQCPLGFQGWWSLSPFNTCVKRLVPRPPWELVFLGFSALSWL